MGESCSKLPSTLSQPVPARFSPTCFLVRRAEYTFHTRDILLGWLIEFSMSVARFSCVSLTRIGIRRALFEYSFENFTIWDKKKNGKADKIHFTVSKNILLRCDCVGVDLLTALTISASPSRTVKKSRYKRTAPPSDLLR